MASLHDRMFQGATWGAHLAMHGVSVTVTPLGGSPATGKGVFEPGKVGPNYFPDEKRIDLLAALSVSPAHFPSWSPVEGDKVEVAGETDVYVVDFVSSRAPVFEIQLVSIKGRRLGGNASFIRR